MQTDEHLNIVLVNYFNVFFYYTKAKVIADLSRVIEPFMSDKGENPTVISLWEI